MELDQEKIKKRFSEINEAIEEIGRIASLEDKEFWKKKEYIAAVKYYLLQVIEAVGSVCVHIAAKKFNKGVSSFGECFEVLGQEKFLGKKLSQKMQKMIKFRNMLTHRYWEIDDKRVLKYAREELDDFRDFIKKVSSLF